jgi:hypothetical protein
MSANQAEVKASPELPGWSQLPEPIRQRVVAQLVKLLVKQLKAPAPPQTNREVGDE